MNDIDYYVKRWPRFAGEFTKTLFVSEIQMNARAGSPEPCEPSIPITKLYDTIEDLMALQYKRGLADGRKSLMAGKKAISQTKPK